MNIIVFAWHSVTVQSFVVRDHVKKRKGECKMNRDFLKKIGLEDEQIDHVMMEHGKTVNSVKEELDRVKGERDSLKEEISNQNDQLEKLKKQAKDNEELQVTIEALKEANKEIESKLQKQRFDYELDKVLIAEKARNPKAVRPFLDTETMKLDEDGTIKGLKEQLEEIKESEPYLFASEKEETPSIPTHTPGQKQKSNDPKDVDPYELGKQKAMERHGNKKEDE